MVQVTKNVRIYNYIIAFSTTLSGSHAFGLA